MAPLGAAQHIAIHSRCSAQIPSDMSLSWKLGGTDGSNLRSLRVRRSLCYSPDDNELISTKVPSNLFLRSPCNVSVLCCSVSDSSGVSSQKRTMNMRRSADEVRDEILRCYDIIHKLGKGVVYLGSSRVGPDHPHFSMAMELGREVALLLDCTTWMGAGPGLMDAVGKGALHAGKPVGGFKIAKEAGQWTSTNYHPYLEDHVYYTCRFFSARKHGLVDAGVRDQPSDRTAFVALPGGLGTLDEIFEIMTLKQLDRIGSNYPVPFLLMNYDGFYSKLLDFLASFEDWGAVSPGEIDKLWTICETNEEAIKYLAEFYNIKQ
ncbi:hypothetical protein KP509_32G064500 [Ceratopteris richardii]|uniref:Cytokinin riboside 5'-monophosphate phosphoribohydrolase n=1 Tax=Ceratopteris richardii TaxID=49495 RepID=A0A8T2QUN0_CERRI|nr:hypothetical protein KP509_32G064500 [Ceratopteris richardii]